MKAKMSRICVLKCTIDSILNTKTEFREGRLEGPDFLPILKSAVNCRGSPVAYRSLSEVRHENYVLTLLAEQDQCDTWMCFANGSAAKHHLRKWK